MKKECSNCFHAFIDKDEKGIFYFCGYDWWSKKTRRELQKKLNSKCKKWAKKYDF